MSRFIPIKKEIIIGVLIGLAILFILFILLLPCAVYFYQAEERDIKPQYSFIIAKVTNYVLTDAMANGKQTHSGAAACSRAIPLETKIEIDGRPYTCEDRLSKQYDDRFDLWTPKYEDAINWGIQEKLVKVYD